MTTTLGDARVSGHHRDPRDHRADPRLSPPHGSSPPTWPEFVQKEQRRQEQAYDDLYDATAPHRPAHEIIYDLLYPICSCVFVGLNILMMFFTYWGMMMQYNPWMQGQVTAIGIGSLAAVAMIHKWVVRGPDQPPHVYHRDEA